MSSDEILDTFRQILGEVEERDFAHISGETPLAELDVDSVAMMEVIGCMEDDLDITIPDGAFTGAERVRDIVAAISAHLN